MSSELVSLDMLDGGGGISQKTSLHSSHSFPTVTSPTSPSGSSFFTVSDEVQHAMDQLLPRDDPLYRADFDLVSFINARFPTEQSLAGIDDELQRVAQQTQEIDTEIADCIQQQSSASRDGHKALLDANQAIQLLFTRIREIKQKTDSSEMVVKEITRDIKQLDFAKKNLTTSIKTLNHLHMLLVGVEELSSMTKNHDYAKIADYLPGIVSVMDHFKDYQHIPQIKQLSDQVKAIQTELASQIIHSASGGAPLTPTMKMADACRVVAVLGSDVRRELIEWFVELQLNEYLLLFEDTQDAAWLDRIEERYDWFIKLLVDVEQKFGNVFPDDWDVPKALSLQFCQVTRQELSKIMKKRSSELEVQLFLHAVSKTSQFEAKMIRRFPDNPFDAAEVEKRSVVIVETVNPCTFRDIISHCFEAHLNVYTDAQDKNLNELIDRFVERVKEDKLPQAVTELAAISLKSSADLFMFYKKSLIGCQQISSRPTPLLALSQVFKKYLREYSKRCLHGALPRANASQQQSQSFMQSLMKEGDVPKLTIDEQYQVCCILVTAEYCAETTLQLQDKLKEKVGSEMQEKIDMSHEQEVFHQAINTCIQILVVDLDTACDPALQAMTKKQWSTVEQVGDESSYVSALKNHLRERIPHIRDYLAPARKYFIQICIKFATHCLGRCRPLSVHGCEQLLLDTHALKEEFLGLPTSQSHSQRKPPQSFTRIVAKGMGKAEMILKVVMADASEPKAFLDSFCRLLPDGEMSDLQRVLEMRNVRSRQEQTQILELYRQRLAKAANSSGSSLEPSAAIQSQESTRSPGLLGLSSSPNLNENRKHSGEPTSTNSSSMATFSSYAGPLMALAGMDTSADSRIKRLEKLLKKRV